MAAAATVAAVGYSMYESRKAAKAAKKQTNEMVANADRTSAEAVAEREKMRRQKSAISFTQRTALLRGAQGGGDRAGSILTGPGGVGGATVLGA